MYTYLYNFILFYSVQGNSENFEHGYTKPIEYPMKQNSNVTRHRVCVCVCYQRDRATTDHRCTAES